MNTLITWGNRAQDFLDATRQLDFLGPLALRLYLVPVFWVAGMNKIGGFDNVVAWFGNAEWGLGLPFPAVMVSLVIFAELGGSMALLLGLATRWMSVPLMIKCWLPHSACTGRTVGRPSPIRKARFHQWTSQLQSSDWIARGTSCVNTATTGG